MKAEHSRTQNTFFNFTSSLGGQLLTVLLNFVTRTVFIQTLGKDYLGINGLFSNILSVLSLAEFGVGNAILYKLYDPIAKKDYNRISALMHFYKTAYRVIGIAVMIIGICMIPFLPLLISDYDKLVSLHINAILIYSLYLLKTVSSYLFFAYRSAIIQANQKEYLINLVSYVFMIVSAVVQIVCLYAFGNFIIYAAVLVFQVIGQNTVCALLSNRMFPYINQKGCDQVSRSEIKEIARDCGALFLYRLNNVVLKATDNIIISIHLGLSVVGEYSNYYIFYTTINTLFAKIYNSVAHSLGNLHTGHDREHEYKIFEVVILLTAIIGGTAAVGVFICSDKLIDAWIGKDWIINQPFSLLMGLELYTLAFREALSKYRNTMGLFQQAKYRPLAGMLINLIVSVLLVPKWGIYGVLVGTIVADWSTMMWFDPIIIHKYGFEKIVSVKRYFIKYIKYVIAVCIVGSMDLFICSHITIGHKWLTVIVYALICGVSVPGFLLALCSNTDEGRYTLGLLRKYALRLLRIRGR